jgi:uncharacterized protein YjbJ (UPF0337 family)
MSIIKDIKYKAAMAGGSARKAAGRATANRHQRAKGRREYGMGDLMRAMAKVKDAFRR